MNWAVMGYRIQHSGPLIWPMRSRSRSDSSVLHGLKIVILTTGKTCSSNTPLRVLSTDTSFMTVRLQILILFGMASSLALCQLPRPSRSPDTSMANAGALPAPILDLQHITHDAFPDKAVITSDDDDLKDDQRSHAAAHVYLGIPKPCCLSNTNLPTLAISCRIAKHPRIYSFCTLLI